MRQMNSVRCFAAACLLLLATDSRAQEPAFHLKYTEPMTFTTTVKVLLSFGGSEPAKPFVVDTGSVGIVVPRRELPEKVAEAVEGKIRYTSSGLVVDGFWTKAIDVTLGDSGAVAHVPVFAATGSRCEIPASNACAAGTLPHMMGIGFGRPDAYATPDRNPLLHLKNLPKGHTANYLVTREGLDLGLRRPEDIEKIKLIHLTSMTREGMTGQAVTDYNTPPAEIRINDGDPQKATVLIDTGITDALVALTNDEPEDCRPLRRKSSVNCVLEDGTKFRVTMVGGAQTLSFALGDGGATTPSSAHWVHLNLDEGSFLNTGIRALAKYKVFYDGTKGTFGLAVAE